MPEWLIAKISLKILLFLLKIGWKSNPKKILQGQQDEILCNDLCLVEYIFDRNIYKSESSRQKNRNRSTFSNFTMI